jgi:tRNA (cmo5U34)-methyltransferase
VLRDNLFAKQMGAFEFNQAVTDVFDDMIHRSVPFYRSILQQIAQLVGPKATIYDLGCSTGGLVPFLNKQYLDFDYIGVDKSPSMIQNAQQHASNNIQFVEADLIDGIVFREPTTIICNLVLQFIHPSQRQSLIQEYMAALPMGGKLIIVEKVRQKNEVLQRIYKESYHELKRSNGYSQAEIDHKDHSLEGILISETSEFYWNALADAGASTVDSFFKWYNFEGMVGIK